MDLKSAGGAERLGHAFHLLRKSTRHVEEMVAVRLNNAANRHPDCHRYHRRLCPEIDSTHLCAYRSETEEYSSSKVEKKPRRCGDTRFSRSPDNGPFVRHCVRGTLIVSLRPDDLRGYDSRPLPPLLRLSLPSPFLFHPCVLFSSPDSLPSSMR